MVATAKPRRLRSATTSKYFSMNSPRPWNRHTVPRRGPRVASQRAKRSRMPLGHFKSPVVAPLGAGFLASATSSMWGPPCTVLGGLYSSRAPIDTGVTPAARQEAKRPRRHGRGLRQAIDGIEPSVGPVPAPRRRSVGIGAEAGRPQRLGADDLAGAALDGQHEYLAARTPRADGGDIALHVPAVEVVPALAQQPV